MDWIYWTIWCKMTSLVKVITWGQSECPLFGAKGGALTFNWIVRSKLPK